jgi:Asp-tRNA(Asn)/Glu-tRNA(Gln) amidotransferase A subunit family amidase
LRKDRPLIATSPRPDDVRSLRVAAWSTIRSARSTAKYSTSLPPLRSARSLGVSVTRKARPDIDPDARVQSRLWLVFEAMTQVDAEHTAEGRPCNSHRAWLDAHMAREAIRPRGPDFFTRYDAVLMPVCFVPPFAHLQKGELSQRNLTCNGRRAHVPRLVR